MAAIDYGLTGSELTLTYNPKSVDATGTVTFTQWPDEYHRDSLTISYDEFDNSPSEPIVEPIEAPTRPRAPPPKVQLVLNPTSQNLTPRRPRMACSRAREGGIGIRNWQCRRIR